MGLRKGRWRSEGNETTGKFLIKTHLPFILKPIFLSIIPFLFLSPFLLGPSLFPIFWGEIKEGIKGGKEGGASEKVFDGEPKGRRITFATKYFGESGSG